MPSSAYIPLAYIFGRRLRCAAMGIDQGGSGRCQTCRHWDQDKDSGECLLVTLNRMGPTLRGGALLFPSTFLTGPNYGCVNHESKEMT